MKAVLPICMLLLCLIFVFGVAVIITSDTVPPVVVGDVNGDGRVNAVDLTMMKRQIIGMYNLTSRQIRIGDVNHNGRIDDLDLEILVDVILERSPAK